MRRRLALFGILLVGAAALVGAAGWNDLSQARAQLNEARRQLSDIAADPAALRTPEGRSAARRELDGALQRIARARSRVIDSRPIAATRIVPGFGRQRAGVLELVADARAGTEASRDLLRAVDDLAERTALRDGAVPLDGLRELEGAVRTAGQRIEALPAPVDGLWGSLADARRRLNDVAADTGTRLLNGADALGAAQSFMGRDGPRRYFVAVQNNAEMRDQGMVLSFAVARFEQGRLTVERTGPIGELRLDGPVDVPLGSESEAVFGHLQPRQLWQSVNAGADFTWSARTMLAMYRQATGQTVDGVIAIDVRGLEALLRVVGAVTVAAHPEAISADNAAEVLLDDFYDLVPVGDQTFRKERLGDVARAVVARLTSGSHDAVALGRELGEAAAMGHFRLWSAVEAEEGVFERTGLGGAIAAEMPDRTLHLSVQNATATKLDYHLRHRAKLDVYVSEVGTAVVRTQLTVRNDAPAGAAPSYQLGPDGFNQERPGQYIGRIYFWGPRGAAQLQSVPESGLTLNTAAVTVEPGGEEQSVVFETVIPTAVRDGRLELRLVPQPTLVPYELEVVVHPEGWDLSGERRIETTWDRTLKLSWGLRR